MTTATQPTLDARGWFDFVSEIHEQVKKAGRIYTTGQIAAALSGGAFQSNSSVGYDASGTNYTLGNVAGLPVSTPSNPASFAHRSLSDAERPSMPQTVQIQRSFMD